MEFKAGEVVQIARIIGQDYPINNQGIIDSNEVEWVNCVIENVSERTGIISVCGYDSRFPEDTWNVSKSYVGVLLRKLIDTQFASNCLDCKEPLIYDVPFNHKNGYVCFSCSSTNGWKYK